MPRSSRPALRVFLNAFDLCATMLIAFAAVPLGFLLVGAGITELFLPGIVVGAMLAGLAIWLLRSVCTRLDLLAPPATPPCTSCPACGYPTRGLAARRCPECGGALPEHAVLDLARRQFPVSGTGV